jgi:hypothetical protein
LLIEALCPVLSAWSLIADLISGLTPGLCSAQRDFHDLLLSPTYFIGSPTYPNIQHWFTYISQHTTLVHLHIPTYNIGSPTYPLSKYLAKLLKTFCAKNEFSIDNGKEFADFVKSQTLGTDETIVSFDVVNLFTSIPVPLALNIVQKKLKETDSWKSHTALQEEQVVKLLKFLPRNCYYKFNETHFHQKSGCAMGSPVKPVFHLRIFSREANFSFVFIQLVPDGSS